jgi:acyl-CoA synthetase (AMP-forming)/AMP-acid ligase II
VARDWLRYHATASPDGTAVIDVATAREFSYGSLSARIAGLAAQLAHSGVKSGDRVESWPTTATDAL